MASKEKINKNIKIIEEVAKKPILKKGGSGTIFIQLKTLGLDKLFSKKSVGGEMLKNPQKADLDKDGKLSSYEKKRGKAIEANMKAKKGKMMYASMGMEAKSTRGYGAARTSGMGLQDEQLVPGKSLDYYKDLM